MAKFTMGIAKQADNHSMRNLSRIIFLLFCLLLSRAFAGSWDFMQGNQYLTGNNDELVPSGTNLNWAVEFPQIVSYPVPLDGRIFLSSMDGNLYCFDIAAGGLLWKYQTPNPIIRSAVAEEERVIFVSGNTLYCLDAGTGELIWSSQEPSNYIYIYPIIDDGRVIYGTRKKIICRETASGRLVWENTGVSLYGGSMTAFDGLIVVQSRDYGAARFTVTALDSRSGKTVWQKDIEQDNVIATPVIFEKKVYVSSRKLLYCLDVYTGQQDWVKLYSFEIASDTVFASGNLYVATANGEMLILDPANGDVRKVLVFRPGRLPFVVVGESLFVFESATGVLYKVGVNNYSTETVFRSGSADSGGRFSAANANIFLPVRNRLYAVGGKQAPLLLAESRQTRTIRGTLRASLTNAVRGKIIAAGKSFEVNGDFSIEVPDTRELTLSVIADKYLYKTVTLQSNVEKLDIVMEPAVRDKKFVLRSIYFDFNSSDLKTDSLPVLIGLKDYLELNKDLKILIQGHTDDAGSADFNMDLSRKRAERVREFLVKNGIGENRLEAEGLGESRPIADNSTEQGRASNRRIEFIVR